MTWIDAAPILGTAIAAILLPGVAVVAAAGLRGVLLASLAPVASVAAIAVAAVAAQWLGTGFGLVPVVVTTGVAALLVAAVRWVGRRGEARPWSRREWRSLLAGLVGAVVGGSALALGVAEGLRSPDRWPQTFDAVFHLSALEHVVSTGDGSSLTLGSLAAPGQAHAFYPGAWHDLAALVSMLTGASAPVAANAVSLATVAVIWPLGCVGLTRVAVGPRPGLIAAAGVLSAGVTASPVVLSSYGTLWPNALATAMLPAALALVGDLVGAGRARAVPIPSGCVLLAGAVGGLGLAHPNVVVSLLVLAVPVLVVGTWPRGVRWRAAGITFGAFVTWLVTLSPAFAGQRGTSWPGRQTMAQAAGEWASLAPQRLPLPWIVAGFTLVGCLVAWRRGHVRWLVAVHVTAGVLFVLVAGSDGRLSRMVSAAWWDDPYRLAAVAGVAGVPLGAMGLDATVRRLAPLAPERVSLLRSATALAAIPVLAAVVTVGVHGEKTARVIGWWYGSEAMLRPAESDLVERLPSLVADGEKVIGNPWNGAALTGPLGEREAVFPHLIGRWDADRTLLAQSLADVSSRPDVCAALDRLDVHHVLTNVGAFWPGDQRRAMYAGLDVAGRDGFVAVARGGHATLWQVTACGP